MFHIDYNDIIDIVIAMMICAMLEESRTNSHSAREFKIFQNAV